jgi:hypothetical protein
LAFFSKCFEFKSTLEIELVKNSSGWGIYNTTGYIINGVMIKINKKRRRRRGTREEGKKEGKERNYGCHLYAQNLCSDSSPWNRQVTHLGSPSLLFPRLSVSVSVNSSSCESGKEPLWCRHRANAPDHCCL